MMFIKVDQKGISEKKSEIRGFTLVETLVYSAMAIVIIGVLSMLFVNIYSLYKDITIEPRTDRSMLLTIDRLVKDVRSGQDIDLGNSVFGASDGQLLITAVENSALVQKFYKLENGRIVYQEDGGNESFLTPSDIEVTKLQFEYLTTDISEGVRIEIDVSMPKTDNVEIKEYEGFAILRQSYE